MRGYFCIGFIDFMLKCESLLKYTNLFFPGEYKKNGKIILKYFQQNLNKLKCIARFAIKYRKFKKTKTAYILKKTITLSIIYSKCNHEYEKISKRINLNIKKS